MTEPIFEVDGSDKELAMALCFLAVCPKGTTDVKLSTVWRGIRNKKLWYAKAKLLRAAVKAASQDVPMSDQSASVLDD